MKNSKVLFSIIFLLMIGLFTSCDISRVDDFGPEPGIQELDYFENDMLGNGLATIPMMEVLCIIFLMTTERPVIGSR